MRRLFVGLLGGAIGLLSTLVISVYNLSEFYLLTWFLPGFLFGLALIWLRGKVSRWRRRLALLCCSLGYPLASFVGLLMALPFVQMGIPEQSTLILVLIFSFTGAGAFGGGLVAFAWWILYDPWSTRVFGQSLGAGSLLAQAGFLPLIIPSISSANVPLLTVWCAGMLMLVDAWTSEARASTSQA